MGDMADFALDGAMDDLEDYWRYQDGEYSPQEAYDRGFVDELGREYPVDTRVPSEYPIVKTKKASGPGPCPRCGGDTHIVYGNNGKFWGCDRFPDCKGSRNG